MRFDISASWLLALLASLLMGFHVQTAHAASPHVVETTMAAPDVVAVEIRDPAFVPGRIVALDEPSDAEHGAWIEVDGEWARVISPDKDYARTEDRPPQAFLDRRAVGQAEAYGEIGDRGVTAVYRKSVPYDSGTYRDDLGDTINGSSFKHYVYLQLDGDLAEGEHMIRWPQGMLPETPFAYDERRTRAISIRASQLGYAPGDEAKIAYLALWLPGGPNDGAVDFRSYGMETFSILDEDGETVLTNAIELRRSPLDPEPGSGFDGDILVHPRVGAEPVPLLSVDGSEPTRVEAPDHGFADGRLVMLQGLQDLGNAGDVGHAAGLVQSGTGDAFEFAEVDGTIISGNSPPATASEAYWANRAGTYVFELDFSDWIPQQPGIYRVFVPNLGVSDPFRVADDVWLAAARTSLEGLYHQRSGIALDGRFGYSRPAPFLPGENARVLLSKLPFAWSSESLSGFVPFQGAASPAWLTGTPAPTHFRGGYMDAGDWDRRMQHMEATYLLLDTFELLPERARNVSVGIPQSSEVLDHSLYEGTDDLPDLLHEALWNLDFFRRLQSEDGAVRGGIESADTPNGSGEPSYLEHRVAFAYAPDHISTYRYAALAAKLAGVLEGAGKPNLANLYRDSAEAAWRAAERAFADPDAFYSEAIAIASDNGVFEETPWAERRDRIQALAREFRAGAAAALFRLTSDTSYGSVFEEVWRSGLDLYAHMADAAWEYLRVAKSAADAAIQSEIRAGFVRKAIDDIVESQQEAAYRSTKYEGLPMLYGQGSAPDYNQAQLLVRAHAISGDRTLLETMQAASAHILGANQVGLSFTTGLGVRNVKHPLHEDHRAMGVDAPRGITIFGWAPADRTSYEFVFGDYFTPLPVRGARENAEARRVEPSRFSMPLYEYLIEHPLVIMQQEYTVHQTIATTAALWFYLHGQAVSRDDAPPVDAPR